MLEVSGGRRKTETEGVLPSAGPCGELLLLLFLRRRYDPRHNAWCPISPLQQQHADHCVCVAGGHIYAIGGRDYSNALDTVERYDPRTNKWEFAAPLKRKVRGRM